MYMFLTIYNAFISVKGLYYLCCLQAPWILVWLNVVEKFNFFLSRCFDTRSVVRTKLKLPSKSQYFEEYILEDAGKDDNMYFNRKVGGFMVETNGKSTVWYSQEVIG